ncbi:MAG: hypothetical protein ACLRXQ_09640 [Phascolarctobacterium faecium]
MTKAASTMKAFALRPYGRRLPAMIWALLASTAAMTHSAYYGAHLGIGR